MHVGMISVAETWQIIKSEKLKLKFGNFTCISCKIMLYKVIFIYINKRKKYDKTCSDT